MTRVNRRGTQLEADASATPQAFGPGFACVTDSQGSAVALAEVSETADGRIRGRLRARVPGTTVRRGDLIRRIKEGRDGAGQSLTVWTERCTGVVRLDEAEIGVGVAEISAAVGRHRLDWVAAEGYRVATELEVELGGCTALIGGVSTSGSFESVPENAADGARPCRVVRSLVAFPSGATAWSVLADEDDAEPEVLERRSVPACPLDARHAQAVIRVVVASDGGVSQAWAIATDHPRYAADAADAVRTWRFRPGLLDGRPVAGMGTFKLSCQRGR